MATIKKIILLALTTLIMIGCNYNSEHNIDTKTEGFIHGTITIVSSEYIRGLKKLDQKCN